MYNQNEIDQKILEYMNEKDLSYLEAKKMIEDEIMAEHYKWQEQQDAFWDEYDNIHAMDDICGNF